MKVVIAEDEESCSKFIEGSLEPLCQQIFTTQTLTGLLALLNESINAVWLDLGLPDSPSEHTISMLPIIRDRAPNAVLIVVTGWGDVYREAALAGGADVYSRKETLDGFSQPALIDLLSQAAINAMQRGVKTDLILERVAEFLCKSAKSV